MSEWVSEWLSVDLIWFCFNLSIRFMRFILIINGKLLDDLTFVPPSFQKKKSDDFFFDGDDNWTTDRWMVEKVKLYRTGIELDFFFVKFKLHIEWTRNEKKKMANFFSAQDSKIVWIQKIDLMLKSVHTYTHAHLHIALLHGFMMRQCLWWFCFYLFHHMHGYWVLCLR